MQPLRDLAIVLRAVPYEERHRIVTALTENHGMISAMARNCIQSRRFGGTLDPFAASEWLFSLRPGAELYTLTEATSRKSFDGLHLDFKKLALASTFNELILKLAHPSSPSGPSGAPSEASGSSPSSLSSSSSPSSYAGLFRLHANALSILNDAPQAQAGSEVILLNAYLAKLLRWSGNHPQLQACADCGVSLTDLETHDELSCIIANASWICAECRIRSTRHIRNQDQEALQSGMFRLSPLAILDFQVSLRIPIRQVTAHTQASLPEHRELFRFIEALFIFHIPGFDRKPLKSLRFLDLESNVPPAAANLQ